MENDILKRKSLILISFTVAILTLTTIAAPLMANPGGVTNGDWQAGCTEPCHGSPSTVALQVYSDNYNPVEREMFNVTCNATGGPTGKPLGMMLLVAFSGNTHPSSHDFVIVTDPSGVTNYNYNQVDLYTGFASFKWTLLAPGNLQGIGWHKLYFKVVNGDAGVGYSKFDTQNYLAIEVKAKVPPPIVTITAPANGASVSGTIPVTATITSGGATRIVLWTLYVDDIQVNTSSFTPTHWTVNTTQYSFGSHTVKVTVEDFYGQMGVDQIAVYVNNGIPQVNFLSPKNGDVVKGELPVSVDASGPVNISYIELWIDGLLTQNDSAAPFDFLLNTSQYQDGLHILLARTMDAVGSRGQQEISVIFNNTGEAVIVPAVRIDNPLNDAVLTGMAAVNVTVQSQRTLNYVSLRVDGSEVRNWSIGPYDHALNTLAFAEGPHSLQVVAVDVNGSVGQQTIQTIFSNAPPVAVISRPFNGETVTGVVVVNATSPLPDAVIYAHLSIDGILVANNTAYPYTWQFNSNNMRNGQHSLNVTVFGSNGKKGYDEVIVVASNPGPQVLIKIPSPNAIVKGQLNMLANVTSARPVAYVLFRIDGGAVANVSAPPYSAYIMSGDFTNGGHFLNVTAVDDLGRAGSQQFNISIQNPASAPAGSAQDSTSYLLLAVAAILVVLVGVLVWRKERR